MLLAGAYALGLGLPFLALAVFLQKTMGVVGAMR
jgi:cytochrome c biogenesis protein CcdA